MEMTVEVPPMKKEEENASPGHKDRTEEVSAAVAKSRVLRLLSESMYRR
jgi:hypothetical protein